jgi:hypothetical protein
MLLIVKPLPTERDVPKYRHGSAEDALWKQCGKVKRAIQQLEVRKSAPHGFYTVKPAVPNCHVRHATAINTKLNAQQLKCTKNSWTRARAKGSHRRIFTLDKIIASSSSWTIT